MIAYFDTSALVKLVIDEPDSDVAASLWARADVIVSSRLVYPEARAALAAAQRGGRIDERELRETTTTIDGLHAEMAVVGIDEGLARRAGDLAEVHGLRGYHAVHLASALTIDHEQLVLVTWDGDLAAAAGAAGCAAAPRRRRE